MNFIKIKNIIATSFVVLTFFGCSKDEVVNLKPDFALDAISNPSSMTQVEEVLVGGYSAFRAANYYGSGSGTGAGWAIMPDIMSDNLYETFETLANSRAMADWLYDPATGQVASLYSSPYYVIAHANIIIRDIDKFTTPSNTLMANRIKGQAYAMRAMAHFDLFRYFATKFDRNSTTDLALPYTKSFTPSIAVKPTRMPNKEYYDNLFADINQAITLLGNVDKPINSGTASRPYIDRNVVYALSARVNLYAGDWANAITAATNALGNRPLATTQAAFSGMYNQTSLGEIIWNVQVESGQSGPTFLMYFSTTNRSYFRPAPEVAVANGSTGLIKTGDIRYNAFFTSSATAVAVTKFKGKGTAIDGAANFPVFRSGELFLIRAEANARNGSDAAAMADLNELRAARISGYTPVILTGASLISAIADERRAELLAEGHRFFDLKRTTRTITRGAVCGTSTSISGACTLSSTARQWALPFHESIINANPNIVQNPSY